LIGAYDAATAELMAGTLAGTDVERAWVVHGAAGWDEATPIGPFLAFDVTRDAIRRYQIDPRDFGIEPCALGDLAGGDAAANLGALLDVFEGRDRGAHFAALVLQSGLALFIAGRAATIQSGIDMARSGVDSGRAEQWLQRLRQFAVDDRGNVLNGSAS
jgi:anthranilate phosphoribosyltransferase